MSNRTRTGYSARTLHAHQITAMDGLSASLKPIGSRTELGEAGRGRTRPLLMGPTGSGKTEVMASIARAYRKDGRKVILTVPKKQLIDQTVQRLGQHGITEVGVIQADHWMTDYSKPVQVATVQSLQARGLAKVPKASVVLVDEAHVVFEFQRKWMADVEWRRVPFIGFTATPGTKGLGQMYDDLVIGSTTQELIDNGFLSPFKVFAPPSGILPDLAGVKVSAGDYQIGDLSARMQKPQLVADVVKTWRETASHRPTLVFAVDRAHGNALFERFCEAGIFAGYIDGDTPMTERTEIERQHELGRLQVVINIGCLTTGCDWPWVSCIVLARPTKSEMLLTQIVGRGLRTSPETGKTDCLVLDHSSTTERLGLVTDIHWTELDDGKHRAGAKREKKPEALPKECTQCHVMKPPRTPVCHHCGHEAKRPSKVVTTDGALIEATGKKRKQHTMQEKQDWYSACLWELYRNGKNVGRAYYLYIAKFGVAPSHQIKRAGRVPREGPPVLMADVRGTIKHCNIARAKGSINYSVGARP